MALLSIARMGHPILRQKALPVSKLDLQSPELKVFIQDLKETMHEYDGVGLAATQVHNLKQIFVFEVAPNPNQPDQISIPLTVVINPELNNLSEETCEAYEACLSVPGLCGLVRRHHSLTLKGMTPQGDPLVIELEGFPARVVQHEYDHLQGKLYIERLTDPKTLSFDREFQKFTLGMNNSNE